MQTGMVCSRCAPRAGSRRGGVSVRASGSLQASPRSALREGARAEALMAYVLRARYGRDVANLTAGRDQAGG